VNWLALMGRIGVNNIWPLLGIVGAGVLIVFIGLWVEKTTLDALSAAALVSTLGALIWYTIETRGLRLQQAFDSEIRNHPWLKGTDLKIDRVEGESVGMFGRDIVYLPVTNVGVTPAHDIMMKIRWELKGSLPANGETEYKQLVLAPNDTYHLKLCQLDYDDPDSSAAINVEVSYKDFLGGGGSFKMSFVKAPGEGWSNGPMSPYRFWLSDGRKFPAVS
jgi:hypothetical protein